MIGRIVRVLVGFILACLAAGLTIVLFVYTPVELALDAGERVSEVGLLALAAATHSAVFAAPFALIGAAIGEWRNIISWTYYALVGVVIAVIGFLVQYWSETGGVPASILNSYALSAFLLTGLIAGLGLLARLRPLRRIFRRQRAHGRYQPAARAADAAAVANRCGPGLRPVRGRS